MKAFARSVIGLFAVLLFGCTAGIVSAPVAAEPADQANATDSSATDSSAAESPAAGDKPASTQKAIRVGDEASAPDEVTARDEASASNTAKPASAEKPAYNVLFLAIDDLNDWIGCLGGYPGLKTPNLDRLAARGVLFRRAYCAAPACNPSRAALMTGVRPSTSGVYHNDQPWRPAMPEVATLSQHFMANGYDVVGGGKIFHGRFKERASWRQYFARPSDPVPMKRPLNGLERTSHFDWGPVSVEDREMGDHQVVDWAIDYLKQPREKPFFLAVGLFRPHLPWYVPEKYFQQFPLESIRLPEVPDDDLDDIPVAGRRIAKPEGDHRRVVESDNWRRAVQGYLASIAFADHQAGRLLDALDKNGQANRTIVVMWGDHGWHLGEKQHWRKFALWEEATRVPLAISIPGVTSPGAQCERTVNLLDLYPTLVAACDLPAPEQLEGDSLMPLLNDPKAAWDRPTVTTHGRNNHAVRSERWRYIRYEDGSEELYDHEHDPMEHRNLAFNERHGRIMRHLAQYLPEVNASDAEIPGKKKRAGKKTQKKNTDQ
jgi:arylsulfatase A-like enzyme